MDLQKLMKTLAQEGKNKNLVVENLAAIKGDAWANSAALAANMAMTLALADRKHGKFMFLNFMAELRTVLMDLKLFDEAGAVAWVADVEVLSAVQRDSIERLTKEMGNG